MFYLDILKAFQEVQVKYLVVGGFAVYLHGVPRVTNDLDIIISHDEHNVTKLKQVMAALGYRPLLPMVKADDLSNEQLMNDWVKNRNMLVFSFSQPSARFRQVDILLAQPLNFEEAYSRRSTAEAGGVEINLVNTHDLIAMKKFSGRAQDMNDIEHLKRVNKINGKEG